MILGCTPVVIKPEYIFATLTLMIGVFVAYTGYNQYLLSKGRFKLDLFDKRFSVYKVAQVFLINIRDKTKIDMDQILKFKADTQDSVFLFDEDISNYLKTIGNKALELLEVHENLDGVPKGEDRSEMCRKQTDLRHWLISQLPELKNKFAPYLEFKTWK
jgi:hypothetical protein